MMTDRVKSQRNAVLESIDKSTSLDENDKLLFRDLINDAADSTNGLETPEKIQKISETVFSLVMLKILDKCSNNEKTEEEEKSNKITNIFSTIVECKWAICVLVGILSVVLILRPELSSLLNGLM